MDVWQDFLRFGLGTAYLTPKRVVMSYFNKNKWVKE